jgi:hypothetical protein
LTSVTELCDTAPTMSMRAAGMSMCMPMVMRFGEVRAIEG